MFYNIILDHDNDIIKENFNVNCQNTDRLNIKLLLINKEKNNIDLYKCNYIDIIYNDNIDVSLINRNKNAISFNLEKINANENAIKNNDADIAYNLREINNIENNKIYLKNIYNILFYDKKTQIDIDDLFYEKVVEVNFKKMIL